MATARIVYASMTGNTEECMSIVQEKLEELGLDVIVEEGAYADPYDFLEDDICVVGTYTWGDDGDLPDEMIDFYEELAELDLSNKIYGVFGTGDTFYEDKFCQAVTDFDQLFMEIGAVRGAEKCNVELDPDEEDIEHLEIFAEQIVQTYEAS